MYLRLEIHQFMKDNVFHQYPYIAYFAIADVVLSSSFREVYFEEAVLHVAGTWTRPSPSTKARHPSIILQAPQSTTRRPSP